MEKRPNILFLLSDQHRWSALNCYGNSDVISPNFDRLAEQGVRYDRCVSSAPMCCPFRATMQTGLHTHQHGVVTNKSPWLGSQFRSLADYFNDAGYETCFIGKAHWGRSLVGGSDHGFVPSGFRMRWKHWFSTSGHAHYDSKVFDDQGNVAIDMEDQYQPTAQTDLAIEQIRSFADKPWLMQLNWGPPHTVTGKVRIKGVPLVEACHRVNREYGFGLDESLIDDYPRTKIYSVLPQHLIYDDPIMPPEYLDQYAADALQVDPNVAKQFHKLVSYHLKEYYGMVTSLDDELGRLLAFLRETGQDENTLVIYTSDHGDKIGAHCELTKFRTKSTWHQNSCRVPLIAWGPGLGIAQGQVSDTPINSVDFLPTLLEVAGLSIDAHLPGSSFVDTFTVGSATREREVLLSLESWRAIYDGQYLYAVDIAGERPRAVSLIDTIADPYDMNNLVDLPAHEATQDRLHGALERELMRTSDLSYFLDNDIKPFEN